MNRLRRSIVRAVSNVPGGRRALARYRVRHTDAFVVSYPRSGRTWLRLLVGRALQQRFAIDVRSDDDLLDPIRLAELDASVPRVEFTHDGSELRRRAKHGGAWSDDKRPYRGSAVLLLVRDPRDVAVSSYFHLRSTLRDGGFPESLPAFVRDPRFGVEAVVRFMNGWARSRHVPARFHLLRYEDLVDDPPRRLREVLSFVGVVDVDDTVVEGAVDFAAFQNMKRMEAARAFASPHLRPAAGGDDDSAWIRRGRVGGHVEYLDEDLRRYTNEAVRRLDPLFGY